MLWVIGECTDLVMNAANQPACLLTGSSRFDGGSMPNETRLDVANPGPFAIRSVKSSDKQRRSDHQDQRECNLNRHDRLSKPDAAKCRAAPLAERGDQRPAAGLQGRRKAAQDTRRHTHQERE